MEKIRLIEPGDTYRVAYTPAQQYTKEVDCGVRVALGASVSYSE